MKVLIPDIRNIEPSLPKYYIRRHTKATGEYKLINGALFNIYDTVSIRCAMEEKLMLNKKAITLSPNVKAKSIARIQSVLNALDILEGK